jgi:predicted nucleic acid-binding protein
LLLDTNILLDAVLQGRPNSASASAAAIWSAVEQGKASGIVAPHTVTTAYYFVEKALGVREARQFVALILQAFEVAPLDGAGLRKALDLKFNDFEDAVCVVAAQVTKCDYVVTRDLKGFRTSPVRCLSPEAARAMVAG